MNTQKKINKLLAQLSRVKALREEIPSRLNVGRIVEDLCDVVGQHLAMHLNEIVKEEDKFAKGSERGAKKDSPRAKKARTRG